VKIKIRKVSIKDLEFVYFLKNEVLARKNSINSNKILFKDHKIWFKKKIKDKNTLFYLILSENLEKIGTVRYDFEYLFAKVSINIDLKFRNLGYGTIMLKETDKLINKNVILVAVVKKSNAKSLKIFKKNKYIILDKTSNQVLIKIIKKK
tara:strand:- start:167 stop:616 length:450 start_codon:yes stop_codon:yes gene_type:complete